MKYHDHNLPFRRLLIAAQQFFVKHSSKADWTRKKRELREAMLEASEGPLAQSAEHPAHNRECLGSSPGRPTNSEAGVSTAAEQVSGSRSGAAQAEQFFEKYPKDLIWHSRDNASVLSFAEAYASSRVADLEKERNAWKNTNDSLGASYVKLQDRVEKAEQDRDNCVSALSEMKADRDESDAELEKAEQSLAALETENERWMETVRVNVERAEKAGQALTELQKRFKECQEAGVFDAECKDVARAEVTRLREALEEIKTIPTWAPINHAHGVARKALETEGK